MKLLTYIKFSCQSTNTLLGTPLFKCNEATTEHNNTFECRLWPCHHDEHELLTKNVICAQHSGLNSYISLQLSLSIFTQKYLCICEDTYLILQNKYLHIYDDSFRVKILTYDCALNQAGHNKIRK